MSNPAKNIPVIVVEGDRPRILIVDDDAMLRTLMRIKLNKNGYEVIEASDGSQALKMFAEKSPDIVLMDANMPGTNGFDATAQLRQFPGAEKTPILMVSALEDDTSVDHAFSVGATEYISKPVCWPLLLHRLANICEATRIEKEIIQARSDADQANLYKSEFLANMSHELRTPMHAILSFSELGLLKVADMDAEKLERYFSRISESGKRLLILLNDLLDLSKLEAGQVDLDMRDANLADLASLVAAEMDGLVRKRNMKLLIESPPESVRACCDAEKVKQVVCNLLSNAIKFSPEGSQINLDFGYTTLGDNKAVSVTVTDQGVGIADDELELVFDKFVQSAKTNTGAGGTGLGLAISKEIIERHGGAIYALSKSDGASFEFCLPVEKTGT